MSTYKKLKEALEVLQLELMTLGDEQTVEDNIEEVLKAWLIGVSVGLGAICIILIIVFVIKVRR